jgi:hypothetical protein
MSTPSVNWKNASPGEIKVKVEVEVEVKGISKFLVPFLRQGMPCSNVLLFQNV